MRFRAFSFVLSALFFSSANAKAFTLNGSSSIRGWQKDTLSFQVNSTNCPIAETELYSAIDSAIGLLNSIPTSRLKLERGGPTSLDGASAVSGSATAGTPTPTIICEPNFRVVADGVSTTDEALPVDFSDYVPAFASVKFGNALEINYGYLILNAETGFDANIANLPAKKLAIVIAHELGHVLGLGHTSDINSLMYYDATLKATLSLSQDDMDGISYLYPRQEPADGIFGCGTLKNKDSGSGSIPPGSAGAVQLAMLLGICGLLTRWTRGIHV